MSAENNTPVTTPEVVETAVENQENTPVVETKAAEASAAPETKKEQEKAEKELKKAIKKLQLKIDGKEVVEELPFELPDDPAVKEYMTRQLQLAKMAHQRANQYSTLDKEVRSFINELRANPEKVLADPAFGVDLKAFATKIIEQEIEQSKKTPEQIEKEKLETELKRLQAERETEKKELQEKQLQLLEQQEYERYDREMTEVLSASDLPKSPYVVKKMADYMLLALENGMKDVSPKDILPLVREEIHKDIKEMFGIMPEDVIEGMIGKDTIGKLRKRNVAKAKEAPPVPVQKAVTDIGKTEAKKEAAKKMSYREFFRK